MELVHTIYEPEGSGPHPAIVALHGWGANAFDLLTLGPFLAGGRCLMVCPQGPIKTAIGAGVTGYGWFPLSLGGPPDLAAILAALDALKAFLGSCLSRYPIDPKKVILLGFSQGGVMAAGLALSDPERCAALVALSSWLPKEFVEIFSSTIGAARFPTLIQHGSADELIDVERARDSVETLRDLRVPVTYREYDMGHEISPRSLSDLSSWLEEKVLSPIIVPG